MINILRLFMKIMLHVKSWDTKKCGVANVYNVHVK